MKNNEDARIILDVADRVESLMKEKGLTRKDVPGITDRGVSDWRRKFYIPSAITLFRVAQRLDVSVEYLITGKEKETPTNRLAHDIASLPIEYRDIIETDIEKFKRLCFKQQLGIS